MSASQYSYMKWTQHPSLWSSFPCVQGNWNVSHLPPSPELQYHVMRVQKALGATFPQRQPASSTLQCFSPDHRFFDPCHQVSALRNTLTTGHAQTFHVVFQLKMQISDRQIDSVYFVFYSVLCGSETSWADIQPAMNFNLRECLAFNILLNNFSVVWWWKRGLAEGT